MSSEIERIESGIGGLDELIKGGFLKNSSVLVTGAAGTGKTIFCSQFIWKGLKEGENCMFITFEEKPEKIRESAGKFGWDFKKYEEKGQLVFEERDPYFQKEGPLSEDKLKGPLSEQELVEKDIDRIALDSTSLLSLYWDKQYDVRRNLFHFITLLQESGVTTVLTTESSTEVSPVQKTGVEEYICDGVIELSMREIGGEVERILQVKKLRATDIDPNKQSFQFTDSGIEIMEK